ncbi:MAG: hypothetical protein JXA13_12450 [Anaerolineales bacterium]|nr:hypothetical protein [Anaerolineales bacterium]
MYRNSLSIRFLGASIVLMTALSACGQITIVEPAQPPFSATPHISTPTFTNIPSTITPLPTTETYTPQPTAAITNIPTETPVPTYTILRGKVLKQANCRYGPGWSYLYKYGLVEGSNLEIIGRLENNKWLYVQAIGGNNPCWVKADLIDINGNLPGVEVTYPGSATLPISPYYPPTTVLSATRSDKVVTVSWQDIPLRAGDEEDENMNHYIIEVWRCEAGEIVFEPLATNALQISFIDEMGCSQISHGRIFVQEKHGFAGPAEIPWPPFEG